MTALVSRKRKLRRLRRKITYSDSFLNFISSLTSMMIRIYMNFLRVKVIIDDKTAALDRRKIIVAFWHGRLLLPVSVFGSWHMAILTDKSWAAEVLTRIILRFGHCVVRGSSKHGGFRGLLDMKTLIEKGHGGALAVDGPHGPIYKIKPGVLYLSYKLGYPIVPLTFGASRAWTLLSTWDHFVIPKPFSKCLVHLGPPLYDTVIKGKITPEMLGQILMEFAQAADRQVQFKGNL
jgi:lysophospholipid acyltransferase (LPLAT)-like uncharacterized protein